MKRNRALAVAVVTLSLGALAVPAAGALTPATLYPPIPSGYLDATPVPATRTLSTYDERSVVIRRNGSLARTFGNRHITTLYVNAVVINGVASAYVDVSEEHLQCTGTADSTCTQRAELFGRIENAPVTRGADNTLSVSATAKMDEAIGPDRNLALLIRGTFPVKATITPQAYVPLTSLAGRTDIRRERNRGPNWDTIWREGETKGTATASVATAGDNDGRDGRSAAWQMSAFDTGAGPTPIGTPATNAAKAPFLPTVAADGRLANGQDARLYLADAALTTSSGALKTSTGYTLPGNAYRFAISGNILVKASKGTGRDASEITAELTRKICSAGQAWDNCKAATLPAATSTGFAEKLNPDGSVQVTGTLNFSVAGIGVGSLPYSLTATPNGASLSSLVDHGLLDQRPAGTGIGAQTQEYGTELVYQNAPFSGTVGTRALSSSAVTGTSGDLRFMRGTGAYPS